MELKDVIWELMEHFREEAEKSTVTFEKKDCKNEASEVKHTIIPDFWPRTRKVNFRPQKVNRDSLRAHLWSTPKKRRPRRDVTSPSSFPIQLGEHHVGI